MAYFRCTIGGGSGGGSGVTLTVTYSEDFYNATITATHGTTILTQTATSSGSVDFNIPEEGLWTISSTISSGTYSKQVDITLEYDAELIAAIDGSTVTPVNDIQTWLKCAGLNKEYTTLAEVLDDEETFDILLRDSNACDYMARSTTWASTICADADAMARVGKYGYCSCKLLNDSTWRNAIASSSYANSVLEGYGLVPIMTGSTTPSGEVFADSYSGSYYPYKAFDENVSTYWEKYNSSSSTAYPCYVGYTFTESKIVNCVRFKSAGVADSRVKNFKIQGSNDRTSWTDLYTGIVTGSSAPERNGFHTYSFDNSTAYTSYRLYVIDTHDTSYPNYCDVNELQFYGEYTPQTNIIHSAPQDTIYYMDNGDQVVLCTTDANGVGEVDWSELPAGQLTLYSSVAKDPADLSQDYSKTITVTNCTFGGTTEAYLMPDTIRTLYWYGYTTDKLDSSYASTSGYSPTYYTNYISLVGPGANIQVGLGTKEVTTKQQNFIFRPSSGRLYYADSTAAAGTLVWNKSVNGLETYENIGKVICLMAYNQTLELSAWYE